MPKRNRSQGNTSRIRQSILIVEDEKLLARQFSRVLTKSGYRCTEAHNVDQACACLESHPAFDLFIVDIRMPAPSQSGLWFIKKLRSDEIHSAVIVITALEDEDTVQKAVSLDIYGYVIKPISDLQLIITVENALHRYNLEKEREKNVRYLNEKVRERTDHLEVILDQLRRSKKKLQISNNMFRSLFDQSPIGVALHDASGRLLEANPAYLKLFGVKDKYALSNTNFFRDPNWPEKSKSQLQGGNDIDFECTYSFDAAREHSLYKTEKKESVQFNGMAAQLSGPVAGFLVLLRDVTKENLQRQQLVVFKQFAEQAGQCFVMSSMDGSFVYANSAFKKLVDTASLSSMRGKSFMANYPPHIREKIETEVLPNVMDMGYWIGELEIADSHGQTVPTLENYFLIKNKEGASQFIANVISDISDLKRQHSLIKNSLQFTKSLLETIPLPVCYTDNRGNYKGCNQAFLDFIGTDRAVLLGKPCTNFKGKNFKTAIFPKEKLLLDDPETQVYEMTIGGEGESARHIICHTAPYKEEAGRAAGNVCIIIDVTELKQFQHALQASTASFQAIVERTHDAIFVTDTEGIVCFGNKAVETLFGRKAEEMVGRDFGFPIVVGEFCEIELVRPDGMQVFGELRAENTVWEGKKACLLSVRDITKRKGVEQSLKDTVVELKKANDKIIQQQTAVIEQERLKVLLQLAGATAHELNQPLTALLGSLELMKMDMDRPDILPERIQEVTEAGDRINKIVKKIQNIRQDQVMPTKKVRNTSISNEKLLILSIEDNDKDYAHLKRCLKGYSNIELQRSTTFSDARSMLDTRSFDLLFLDHLLPDGNGLDFLNELRESVHSTPAIVITGQGDEMIASRMIQAGAYDYIPKHSVSEASLNRAIANAMEKARLRRDMQAAQKKMAEMSSLDGLTKLYNRRYFMEALEREIDRSRRYATDLTICLFDLDHFKSVNDNYGHQKGDEVLQVFAQTLKASTRSSDLACRYGGEEFVLICPNSNKENALESFRRLQKALSETSFEADGSIFTITVSCGIACLESSREISANQLINLADQALYDAKEQGRDRAVFGQAKCCVNN